MSPPKTPVIGFLYEGISIPGTILNGSRHHLRKYSRRMRPASPLRSEPRVARATFFGVKLPKR